MGKKRKGTPKKNNHNGGREPQKLAFLASLAEGHSVSYAACKAGVHRRTIYKYRDSDPEFAASWDDAYEQGTDRYEDKLFDQSEIGNMTAIIFALKARRPEKYAERAKLEHTGASGGPIELKEIHDYSRLSDSDLDRAVAEAERILSQN